MIRGAPDRVTPNPGKGSIRSVVREAGGGDLAAALGRATATTFVMPIDEDMFFPVRDRAEEHKLVPNSELRVVENTAGLGFEPGYIPQINRHLGELLGTPGCRRLQVSGVRYSGSSPCRRAALPAG